MKKRKCIQKPQIMLFCFILLHIIRKKGIITTNVGRFRLDLLCAVFDIIVNDTKKKISVKKARKRRLL